jgi:CHAT domain-containing protein
VLTHEAPDAGAASQPRDEPVAEGDLELLLHPGKMGWFALVTGAATTTAHRVPPPEGVAPPELAAALLEPMAARLAEARRLRVRAYGSYRSVDVHALPFRGAPLLAQLAIDYPLGLRASGRSSTYDRRALIVGDPTGDLPGARAEATLVQRATEPRMPSRALVGAQATSPAVAEGLSHAGLFHYAGHGVFAGLEGWESALPLAEGGRLTLGDLLALAPAPRKVVLSGCDAARAVGESEGLGLAQALVTAGSEEVLAPVRPVADALASRLAEALYAGAAGNAACDLDARGSLAKAARAALLEVREGLPAADWAAFRVLAR